MKPPARCPIELWRTALVQRRNLRNPHFQKPYHVSFRRFREAHGMRPMIAKSSPPAPVSPFRARRGVPRSRSRSRTERSRAAGRHALAASKAVLQVDFTSIFFCCFWASGVFSRVIVKTPLEKSAKILL